MSQPLVAPEALAAELHSPLPPVVLDARWNLGGPPAIEEYRVGHVPRARFVDLDAELADPPGPGRHPLPRAGRFEAAMRRHGVSAGDTIVVYDAGGGLSAARAWWLLRYFGHAQVRLLDGGWAAWVEADLPVATDEPRPLLGSFVATPGSMPVLDSSGAAVLARRGVLLDARARARYLGLTEPIDPVAGHIPGARSLPTADNLGPDGRFLAPRVIAERAAAAGAVPGAEVGVYCGSGVTAAHAVLALELAGVAAALYVGSWSEWITDPARPVAVGEHST